MTAAAIVDRGKPCMKRTWARVMATKNAKLRKIAKGQALEVQHLVETTGVSAKLASELLKKYGNDWDRIRREAEMLKSAKE